MKNLISFLFLSFFASTPAFAGDMHVNALNLVNTVYGYLGIFLFFIAYTLVPLENYIHLRKSKPVMLAAGLIWIFVAMAYKQAGDTHTAHLAIKNNLLEYAEIFLFLLTAMTYINSLEERNVFHSIFKFL